MPFFADHIRLTLPLSIALAQARDLRRLTLEMLRPNSKDAKAAFKKDVVPAWFAAIDRCVRVFWHHWA